MRNAVLLGVLGAGMVGLAAMGGGCGGGGGTATGGTGGTGGATSSSSTTSSSSSSVVSTGTGGMGGNHTFETADPIDLDTTLDGDLSQPGAVDFYTFEGKAGQALDIFISAQNTVQDAAFDPTWIDTVVTLYDANKKQIAENNDAMPRRTGDSELITVLPADGTYYVRVEECWTWASQPKSACLGTAVKDFTAYTVGVVEIDPSKAGNVKDLEKGDDAASATPMTYAKAQNGGYYLSIAYGGLKDASDVDAFSFTLPSDYVTLQAGTRGIVSFWVLPAGTGADGSTTPAGKVYLVDPADPTKHLAEIYGPDFGGAARLWPAVDLTKPYLLFVEHPTTAAGTNDFYVVLHGGGASNPVETNDAANDAPDGAELPTDAPDASGHHYYVDGDIINAAADVDHWKVPVGQSTQIAVSCAAQRGGSGLRGFKIDVLDAATMATVTGVTESATADAYTGYHAIPAGATDLLVKMSATSQDPNVTSGFYHCGIHLN